MAACKPVVFQGISRTKFQAVRARLRAQADVQILGDRGTATGFGLTAQWIYDGAGQKLTVQCTAKPFFVTEAYVAMKIRDLVEAA